MLALVNSQNGKHVEFTQDQLPKLIGALEVLVGYALDYGKPADVREAEELLEKMKSLK